MGVHSAPFVRRALAQTLIVTFVISPKLTYPATPPQSHSAEHGAEDHGVPNLAGDWALNKDLSDDPASIMAALHQRRNESSHGPWMHMGGGQRGPDPEKMRTIRQALEAPERLTLAQSHVAITFTDGTGRTQTIATNDKKQKIQVNDRTVKVKAKWEDGHLVCTKFLKDGIKLKETYSVAIAPRQLHVLVDLDASDLPQPVSLRRVYDLRELP